MQRRIAGALLFAALLVGCGACGAIAAAPTVARRAVVASATLRVSPPTEIATPIARATVTLAPAPSATRMRPATATQAASATVAAPPTATVAPARPTQAPVRAAPVADASACGCPQGCSAPPPSCNCSIKGNISDKGEKIYHVPGQQYYEKTIISPDKGERWFCTEDEAVSNGWRRSKV